MREQRAGSRESGVGSRGNRESRSSYQDRKSEASSHQPPATSRYPLITDNCHQGGYYAFGITAITNAELYLGRIH
ncbi:hypothetical protein H6G17_04480 [Chroococcidiopsis sp. FACHB-1243]|uniref:hypothetical protein n=1 Tax=Chroococcidiopsis sp. [FACHB-1243] TaxID=2692781 RepID=UPI0017801408|nr:hypothetical protein [Chroococcidiopsis sp. [FACHB-1243]]MBD2304773.1 hypothetical protein [Chroococcidiopsis sp. [FACHB-1243]]